MISKPLECSTCYGFSWDRTQGFSHPEGSPLLGVAICGEALGENEAIDGLPFRPYAQAGSVLQRVLSGWHGCGLQRGQFLIFNTVQCRPPRNKLEGPWVPDVIQSCQIHRDRIIEKFRPKVILALGDVAMFTLTGFEKIGRVRGYPVWSDQYECWVIGSFHPAYLARGNRNLCSVLREDVKKAVWLARQEDWLPADVDYTLQPTRDRAREFLAEVKNNPSIPLSVDLENPRIQDEEQEEEEGEAEILQIQFSLEPYKGIVFPWVGEFKDITEEILKLPNPKWGHNSRKYDFPLLEQNGFKVAGEWHDTMDAFRMVQSNLGGCYHLQGVGSFFGADQLWKHKMGENIEWYGAMDVDVPQRIIAQLIPTMHRLGVWNLYYRHVVEMEPILVGMTNRGLNRDPDLIQELRAESKQLMNELQEHMSLLVPREMLKTKDYKRTPADIKDLKLKYGGMKADPAIIEEKAKELGYEFVVGQVGTFWRKRFNFVCSSDQLQLYCGAKGYKVPIHPKEDRPTMNEWAVKQLKKETKDPFWDLVQKYQEVKTIKTRYLPEKIDRSKENWHPAEDGKTHSTFFSARTSSGQFSARNPNSQQIPR